VVQVDAVLGDAEFAQAVTLDGEVLGVGGAAGVADQVSLMTGSVRLAPGI
jgi:hypothetical protein